MAIENYNVKKIDELERLGKYAWKMLLHYDEFSIAKKVAWWRLMWKLGFALGTLTGMALSTASARERRLYESNWALDYFWIFLHK